MGSFVESVNHQENSREIINCLSLSWVVMIFPGKFIKLSIIFMYRLIIIIIIMDGRLSIASL